MKLPNDPMDYPHYSCRGGGGGGLMMDKIIPFIGCMVVAGLIGLFLIDKVIYPLVMRLQGR